MRVVVTGAAGFVGSCVVELLHSDKDLTIVPTSRRANSGGRVARFGYQLAPADLAQAGDVRAVMKGADVLVHCAFGGDSDQALAAANLIDAAATSGARHVVHVSTADVYRDRAGVLDESAPMGDVGEGYGPTKARIDQMFQAAAGRFQSMTILRPSIVYGPTSESWTVRPIRRMVEHGWSARNADYSGNCNLIHIADLCRVIRAGFKEQRSGLKVWNVVGPDIVTWQEYFNRIEAALRSKADQRQIERPRSREVLGNVLSSFQRMLPTKLKRTISGYAKRFGPAAALIAGAKNATAGSLTPSEKELYARHVTYSAGALTASAVKCTVLLDEGIQNSVEWARQIGLAP
jgi:nucleoside-diphosphate-sugar epimerase